MKKGVKVLGIIALAVLFVLFAAARGEAQENDIPIRGEEDILADIDVFVDNGERFISFNWSGAKDKIYSRKLTDECYAEYIKSGDNYTLMVYAKSNDTNIMLLAAGASDSDWVNRNFVFSVKLVDATMMSGNSETLVILDDGKESGLFRAAFSSIYCLEYKYHSTLTNGIIQVNVKK